MWVMNMLWWLRRQTDDAIKAQAAQQGPMCKAIYTSTDRQSQSQNIECWTSTAVVHQATAKQHT
jgi:hypothetical protein